MTNRAGTNSGSLRASASSGIDEVAIIDRVAWTGEVALAAEILIAPGETLMFVNLGDAKIFVDTVDLNFSHAETIWS
ncbi:MAG: hypothetical protein IPK89_13695, partial [Sphingomonadales bacterium]|nr:hypothetical protein [Sphingomonadales bacterium]